MRTIYVKFKDSGTFYLSDDNEWICTHENAYIDKACCSGHYSDGSPSCWCYGVDNVVCPSTDCTDIKDWETEDLFNRLNGGRDER